MIINELLKKGSISSEGCYKLVDPYIEDKLLEADVFAFHVNSNAISFQSTVLKRFCEQNTALWEAK